MAHPFRDSRTFHTTTQKITMEHLFNPLQNKKPVQEFSAPESTVEQPRTLEDKKPPALAGSVFDHNPELGQIGTREQYEAFLATVFPDSTFREIVYHGTAAPEKIQQFTVERSNFARAIFFTEDYNFAHSFAYEEGIRDGQVQEQMLNIQNPFDFSNPEHIDELRPIIEQLVIEGYKSENTGITFRNNLPTITIGEQEIQNPTVQDFVDHYMWRLKHGSWRIIETDRIVDFISQKHDAIMINERGVKNIAVFSPNQIKVLGSQKDQQEFSAFVNNPEK